MIKMCSVYPNLSSYKERDIFTVVMGITSFTSHVMQIVGKNGLTEVKSQSG